MNALADQIEHTRLLVKALVPQTMPEVPFALEGRDQQAPIGARARLFVVRADPAAPKTLGWIGTAYRTVLARMVVLVTHDALADFEQDDRIMVEDTDQIVSALEHPDARVNASVLQITCVDRIVEQSSDSEQVRRFSLVFEVEYRVAL